MRNLFYGISLFILVLVGMTPKIASTSLGKPFFLKAAKARVDGDIQIGKMQLTWLGPQVFKDVQISHGDLECQLEEFAIEAPFWSFSGPFDLKNAELSLKDEKIDSFDGKIVGNDFDFFAEHLDGHISLKGKMYSKLDFNVQMDVKQFPLTIIDQRLDEVLGPKIDLVGSISMKNGSGPIDLSIQTENLETTLHGNLTPDALTLREPIVAHLNLTEGMSRGLLKNAGPLFLNGISNKDPITLRIESEGFLFPFTSSLENLKIEKATLDLGRCTCQNKEALATIIGILKRDSADYKEMKAWFAPLKFSVSRGIVEAGRMDVLLADTIHVCTWGHIDLIKDKLDMTLGLTERTLRRAFKIKDLPEQYVLTIDVRGTTGSPEIVKAPAAAKIATLVGTKKLEKRGVLGSLASIFSTPKVDEDVPEATLPFPWE